MCQKPQQDEGRDRMSVQVNNTACLFTIIIVTLVALLLVVIKSCETIPSTVKRIINAPAYVGYSMKYIKISSYNFHIKRGIFLKRTFKNFSCSEIYTVLF